MLPRMLACCEKEIREHALQNGDHGGWMGTGTCCAGGGWTNGCVSGGWNRRTERIRRRHRRHSHRLHLDLNLERTEMRRE
jgi:hypothetical protein